MGGHRFSTKTRSKFLGELSKITKFSYDFPVFSIKISRISIGNEIWIFFLKFSRGTNYFSHNRLVNYIAVQIPRVCRADLSQVARYFEIGPLPNINQTLFVISNHIVFQITITYVWVILKKLKIDLNRDFCITNTKISGKVLSHTCLVKKLDSPMR